MSLLLVQFIAAIIAIPTMSMAAQPPISLGTTSTFAVLEPTLIIAMVVYAAVAWGIITLIEINKPHKDTETL